MSRVAICVDGLSKLYHLENRERYYTLRDAIARAFIAPVERLLAGRGASPRDCPAPSGAVDHSEKRNSQSIWALKDVCFEVREGDVVGVIGRNGAGKSTLLKILSNITEPTAGEARIRGRVSSLLEVGTGFHPELSGRDNIYLNGAILGMPRAEIARKFDEIVAFAEVEKFIDQPVKRFSSGMYMRLAFSVAAHLEPEILLVDEVLAVGDAAFQKKCLGKMETVAHMGRTILFVSHNMAAVRALCSTAICLDKGRIVADGEVRPVIEAYLDTAAMENGVGQIPPQAHRNHTGEVSIEQITLEDGSGRRSTQLRPGESCCLRIRFEIRQSVRQIRLGVGFNTLEGVRIATGHHTDGGAEPIEGNPGVYEISLKLANPFLPGRYVISAGAHSALGGQTVDYVAEAFRFEVLNVPAENSPYESYNSGLVRLGALWERPRRLARV